ncbi:MAG: energy-coupling factor transporter transmembrane protein EcfT [Gloeomargaritaceae cyanobacterium C42_A2020_066]|nr:energy-coupling factor transporter transmembrane protein EcfT [Gloeomargaritaceae cyanobacterium C42_A2020_066]
MDLLRSLPLGLYLEQPRTWLHSLDARVKFFWLMGLLLSPILANATWRVGLVVLLVGITLGAGLPLRVWLRQMGGLGLFCVLVLGISALAPDGLLVPAQSRLPVDELAYTLPPTVQSPAMPGRPAATARPSSLPSASTYRYVLWEARLWRMTLQVTRRSWELGLRVSTLLFTLVYSTTLYLLTTPSEEMALALAWYLQPLGRVGLPVPELTLTLTLALRFVPLVLEEVQNLLRAVRTRAIRWHRLGWKEVVNLWLLVTERLLSNLFLRAEQTAAALYVRGVTELGHYRMVGHTFRLGWKDWLALVACALFWGLRLGLSG